MSDWLWSGQTFRAWWSGQAEFFEQHPAAHVAGGLVLDVLWGVAISLGARMFRLPPPRPWPARVLRGFLTGFTQSLWEMNQVEQWGRRPDQTPNYPYAFAALDVGASLVGAVIAELVRAGLGLP